MKRLPVAGPSPATGASVIPPLYARWIDDLLGAPIEPETNATCADSTGAPVNAPPDPETVYFNPRVKCCTFVPALPSFLVGRILRDHAPERAQGRASVEARIATGIGLTPLGLGRSPAQHVPDARFGHDERYLCPHFIQQDGGLCSIWQHREAVCTTFFCKFVRGAVGASFWSALRRLLEAIEQALAWQCVETLDVGAAAVVVFWEPLAMRATTPWRYVRTGTYAADDLRAIWGRWRSRARLLRVGGGRRREPLVAGDHRAGRAPGSSARHPRARSPRALARAGDSRGTASPQPIRRHHARPHHRAPHDLQRHGIRSPFRRPSSTRSSTSTGAPLGRRWRLIEAQHGLSIDADVVGRLVDFEVLVPAPEATTPPAETSPRAEGS